jgi:undecaprenyl-phosphate galactose phosphotransferase
MPSESTFELRPSGYDVFKLSPEFFRQFRAAEHRRPWWLQLVGFVLSDTTAFLIAYLGARWLLQPVPAHTVRMGISDLSAAGLLSQRWAIGLVLLVLLSQLARSGHYTRRVPGLIATRGIVAAVGLAALCDFVVHVGIYQLPVSAAEIMRWFGLAPLLLLLRGATRAALGAAGLWRLRTVVVGPRHDAERVAAALRANPDLGYNVAAVVEGRDFAGWDQDRTQVRGSLTLQRADCVVLVCNPGDAIGDSRLLRALRRAEVPCTLVPATSTLPVAGNRSYLFSYDVVLMSNSHEIARPITRVAKRALDLLFAGMLLVGLSPILLATAFLIRRDGGPAIFRHKRVGAGGRMFPCMKFRSMHVQSERMLADLLAHDPVSAAEWAATQKLKNDPRITPIGHFLRKTSLDELPQLFNVLRGDMSLVGPRPIVQSELGFYGDSADYYFATRPGVTGLWQVSGRSDTSYERRVELDVWYVRNWSLWHDIAILFKTVPVVLLRRGAV